MLKNGIGALIRSLRESSYVKSEQVHAAGHDALELQVQNVAGAIEYYGAELGYVITDRIRRAAYLIIDDALVILLEVPASLLGG